MNLSEYKKKGILEAYVLGVLDPETTEILETDLKTNIALKEEVEKVEASLSNFKFNFTKGKKNKPTTEKKNTQKPKRTKTEKGIRIILGVLILVMVVMIFLFLSTIYEKNNYQKAIVEQAKSIDSLQLEIQKTHHLNQDLKGALSDFNMETISRSTLTGKGEYAGKNAFLIVPESKSSTDFLILPSVELEEEDNYFQLWSESAGQFRRVGRVRIDNMLDGFIVHPLPRTNLQLSYISLESGTPPSQPIEENLVFRLRN
ncbi:MAG: hypothetical protein EA362_03465 [Saprospirales bacterium]|nr:MAG: hypothetical protein EA362_03465 [Saprospirales bacterium]